MYMYSRVSLTAHNFLIVLFVLIQTVVYAQAPERTDRGSFLLEHQIDFKIADQATAESSEPASKSGFLAVAFSAVLPGMGELYADRFDRGLYNLITDVVLWGGVIGFNAYGNSLQSDARLFAAQRAGADPVGKSDQFFSTIGNYQSLDEYNSDKLVRRELGSVYPAEAEAGYQWNWSSDADRSKYRDLRIQSDQMFNAVGFVALGLIANRVWSAIQSAFFVRRFNSRIGITPDPTGSSGRVNSTSPYRRMDGFTFHFSVSF